MQFRYLWSTGIFQTTVEPCNLIIRLFFLFLFFRFPCIFSHFKFMSRNFFIYKGTLNVISCDPPFKEGTCLIHNTTIQTLAEYNWGRYRRFTILVKACFLTTYFFVSVLKTASHFLKEQQFEYNKIFARQISMSHSS